MQLFVLFVLMMAEAVTVSVLFPFVPFMVRDFHVADTDEKVCLPPRLPFPLAFKHLLLRICLAAAS